MAGDLYCKVYLNGPRSSADLRDAVAAAAGTGFDLRTLRTDSLVIDLIENTDGRGQTDFIGWPFYLEIDADPEPTTPEPFIASIRTLLERLRTHGVQVVPSCDFEDQLQDLPCP